MHALRHLAQENNSAAAKYRNKRIKKHINKRIKKHINIKNLRSGKKR